MSEIPAFLGCYTCRDYMVFRFNVLARALADKAIETGRDPEEIAADYMTKVHDRHMTSGEPLREGGPTRVINPQIGQAVAFLASLPEMEERG